MRYLTQILSRVDGIVCSRNEFGVTDFLRLIKYLIIKPGFSGQVSPHSKIKTIFVFNSSKHEDLAQGRFTRLIRDDKYTLCSFLTLNFSHFFRVLLRISGIRR
jgi:hypothetical protein